MWNVEEFTEAAGVTVEELASYVHESQQGLAPVVRRTAPKELTERLALDEYIRSGGMTLAGYREFLRTFLAEGTRLHHPAYLAHQVAAPDFPAALADFVHGVTNNVMAIYEMGASAATVEFSVIRWMLDKVGFGAAGGGVLTHGGSLANLTALLAARAAALPHAWTEGVPAGLALLAPPSAHYSLTRAAGILGMGANSVIPLATDEWGRIDVARLPEALDTDRRPIALVANACITGTGLYDDLRGIGEFCAQHGIWFHVDGAHGASALLAPEYRNLLDGIELADSVIWDAHKMLRTTLAAAVLTKRSAALDAAFQQEAAYLFYGEQGFDLIGRTVEGTKAELGLKVFLNLAWRGERGLGDYVSRQFNTAHRFWELASQRPGFDCPYEPQSNIVCFRFGNADQAAIREELMSDGSFHLTSTEIGGVRYLRVTVMAPATDDRTLNALLDRVADSGR
jgi:L-2,4-diaminobutyrate decarboxylase